MKVGSCKPRSRTVGMLDQVLRIQIHDLWSAKMSGVVRNVGIIMYGTEGRPRGQLTHGKLVRTRRLGVAGQGPPLVTAEFTFTVRPVELPTQTRRKIKQDLPLAMLLTI